MAKYARGLICLTLTEARCKQLGLPLMVRENHSAHSTNFTVSIEAAEGVTTGISASDRAHTVLAAVKASAKPQDLVQPGHIFPVMSQAGGVLSRPSMSISIDGKLKGTNKCTAI
jgi:3,4-dihydroxy 2-butanone 4-phosphate synthase/GTP cyclohydrolase II